MTPELIAEKFTLSKADWGVLIMLLVIGAFVALVLGYVMGESIFGLLAEVLRWWVR